MPPLTLVFQKFLLYFTLTYPYIDTIVERIKKLGPGAQLCKVDISRALKQLRVDPRNIDLLGIKSGNFYLDLSVPFRFRSGSGFSQRFSDAIRYIMTQNGYPGLINYIDDLILSDLPSKKTNAYQFLISLLQELGLSISASKLVAPTTSAVCLGIQIDTISCTISIPPEKIEYIAKCAQIGNTKQFVQNRSYNHS